MQKAIPGDKFNKLTLIKRYNVKLVNMKPTYYGLFLCDCGTEKMMLYHNVISGKSKCCGCFRNNAPTKNRPTGLKYKSGIKRKRPIGLKYKKNAN